MKTILVPTDYSAVAKNAMNYAVDMALAYKAKIVLFHAYKVPLPTGEVPIMIATPQDIEQENLDMIKSAQIEITNKTNNKIQVEYIVSEGFALEKIQEAITSTAADLVVMGVTGIGKVAEILMGSHASALINETKAPVLVVPENAQFIEISKIVLAYNYDEKVNSEAINKIKHFAKLFNAKILVLDVEKPETVPMYENTTAAEALEKSLEGVEHAMFYSSSEDITDGLNLFADEHKCDWVAMIPHKHSLLSRILNKSNTKKMAFHTHLPLLSVHD